jgi:hypothetical protein
MLAFWANFVLFWVVIENRGLNLQTIHEEWRIQKYENLLYLATPPKMPMPYIVDGSKAVWSGLLCEFLCV